MYSKNILFLILGFSFLTGVFINNISGLEKLSGVLLLIVGVLLLNICLYIKRARVFSVLSFSGIIVGIFLSSFAYEGISYKLEILEKYYYNKNIIHGKIINTYRISDFSREYRIELLSVNYQDIGGIDGLLSLPSNFKIRKGDIIKLDEKILPIENFSPTFNYESFSYSKDIFFKIKGASLTRVAYYKQNIIVDNIDKVREFLLSRINMLYPYEEAIFLGGILLGARESLPKDLKDDFNASGLTHFIAVSGFNITILIVFLGYVLKILPSPIRLIMILASLICFSILVGGGAPVIRASIMGGVAYIILFSGRESNNISLLLFTAICMVVFSPLSLNYDVSFHLSFLAVIGIIYTQAFFKRIFFFLPETLAIKEAFVLTLSALSFALPVMVFNFGQLTTLAVFSNIAVTWTIPLAMLFGFLSLIFYSITPVIGELIAYITWVLLAWDIKVVHFFGGLDWSIIHLDFGSYKYAFEIVYFLILIFIINYFKRT